MPNSITWKHNYKKHNHRVSLVDKNKMWKLLYQQFFFDLETYRGTTFKTAWEAACKPAQNSKLFIVTASFVDWGTGTHTAW